jgi:alkylation response protein AidB-like acyl-CoA dehydrogenase
VTLPAPAGSIAGEDPRPEDRLAAVLGEELSRIRALLSQLELRFAAGRPQAGPDGRVGLIEESGPGELAAFARARVLQRALFDAGLAWPEGPAELGGGGRSKEWALALDQVLAEYRLPPRAQLLVGLDIVAPALAAHGSAQLRERYLPALFRGEIVGCQLFSEPSSGSDLASARTTARRDGEHWIVSGQKVWTSVGHLADVGALLARTDPAAAKHAGLSMFLVDMRAPGVTVRPLRQMTGGAAFNEVFLDEVRVPDADRIGEPGGGWAVAKTSLRSEREAMMSGEGPLSPRILSLLGELVAGSPRREDPVVGQQLARITAGVLANRALAARAAADWGPLRDVAGSVTKLLLVETIDLIGHLVAELAGPRAYLDEDDAFRWSQFVLSAPGLHIAGGTDEIQRNVIAQRGLGLPR